ncbi:hypothetical protein AAHA92_09490 [Salvia divinorum]|uniref:Uncharacterized protein n=1 Tax=Salvia divinorum TaxID=28513 RepID=A0ABD1HRI2_SALDI
MEGNGCPRGSMEVLSVQNWAISEQQLENICKGHICVAFFEALTKCHMLRSLTIYDANVGTKQQEISIHHDTLHRCEIKKCRLRGLYIGCPQLKNSSLKQSDVPDVLLDCPLLRDLDIASCHGLPFGAIEPAAICFNG